jgi:hypothetical protein
MLMKGVALYSCSDLNRSCRNPNGFHGPLRSPQLLGASSYAIARFLMRVVVLADVLGEKKEWCVLRNVKTPRLEVWKGRLCTQTDSTKRCGRSVCEVDNLREKSVIEKSLAYNEQRLEGIRNVYTDRSSPMAASPTNDSNNKGMPLAQH